MPERIEGFIDADHDGVITFTVDDPSEGRYHVEFDYREVEPSPADLPTFGGEPAWWVVDADGPGRLERIPRQKRVPLTPERAAEIQAKIDELLGASDV